MAVGLDPSAFASQTLSMFDGLLAAVSRKSDVCDLFQHLSAAICRIIPYDEAQLVLLTEAGSLHQYARTLDGPCQVSAVTSPTTILDDSQPQILDVVPESDRGMQCGLKVPVQIEDRVAGALKLLSRNPHAYSASDLLQAQQLANCLGHALAYQRLPSRPARRGPIVSARPRSKAPLSCCGPSRACSTSGACFPASRKLPRRCCRMTHWRWSSWTRTVISYARPTRRMTFQTRRSSRTRPLYPKNSSLATSPPRHYRSLNPRTRSRPSSRPDITHLWG